MLAKIAQIQFGRYLDRKVALTLGKDIQNLGHSQELGPGPAIQRFDVVGTSQLHIPNQNPTKVQHVEDSSSSQDNLFRDVDLTEAGRVGHQTGNTRIHVMEGSV